MQIEPNRLKSLPEKFAGFALVFYGWGSKWMARLAKFFQGPHLARWADRFFEKPLSLVGLEAFVAVSLAVYYFFLMLPQGAPRALDGNQMNSYLFTYLSHHPTSQTDLLFEFNTWKARLPGPMISGFLVDLSVGVLKAFQIDPAAANPVFGGYKFTFLTILFDCSHALWLLLFFGVIIFHRRDALLEGVPKVVWRK